MRHNASRTYYRIVAYRDTSHDYRAAAYPHAVAYGYRRARSYIVKPALQFNGVSCRIKRNVGRKKAVIADMNFRNVKYGAVVIAEKVFSDKNM